MSNPLLQLLTDDEINSQYRWSLAACIAAGFAVLFCVYLAFVLPEKLAVGTALFVAGVSARALIFAICDAVKWKRLR